MLRGLHKASSTWLGKAIMAGVMGVLVISFAIWGIGDIFRGFGQNSVAEIGSTEVSIEQFRQYYNDRLRQISRQARRIITPEQARELGIDRQIVAQLVAETTFDEQAKKLRLGLSDEAILTHITSDPAFQGPNGTFDRARFEEIIRNAGFSEARFIDEQKRNLLRQQIGRTVGGDVKPPTTTLQAVSQFQNERRDIEYLTLGPDQAGDIPAPTGEQLNTYFDEHKALFRAPEYRKLTLLSLSPASLAKPDAVPDDEAKTYYEQHKDKYGKPERREIQQIVFQNEQEAASARERIAKGSTFSDIAKDRGLKSSDLDLGMVTRADIIDPDIAEAAFSIKPGEVSQPVKGRFGTVLLVVGKVEPGEQKPFSDIAAQIKQELAETRARSDINNLRDKVEDERASGATLTETAKKLGVKAVTIEAVDRAGRDPQGKAVPDLATIPNVVTAAFASDVGVDNEAVQTGDGSYLYFEVNSITPSRDRALAEVKDQVEARWREDEIGKRLQAKANDMVSKLKAGTPIAQLATENAMKVQKAANLQRGQTNSTVPDKLVAAVFSTAKGAPGTAGGDKETQRFVFRVIEVTVPAFDAKSFEGRRLTEALTNSYADDLAGEYITRLENDYGVHINQGALNQVIGGGPAQQP
jgi:peptidyl-prolyl cis-trans isomerase D